MAPHPMLLCDGPCDRSGRGDQHIGRDAKTSSYFGGRDDWTDFPASLPKSVLSRWRGMRLARATPGPTPFGNGPGDVKSPRVIVTKNSNAKGEAARAAAGKNNRYPAAALAFRT